MDKSIFIVTLIVYYLINKKEEKTTTSKKQQTTTNNLVVRSDYYNNNIDGNINKINMDDNNNNNNQQQQNIMNNNDSSVIEHPERIVNSMLTTNPSTTTTTPTNLSSTLLVVENNNNTSSPTTTHQSKMILDHNINNNINNKDDEESIDINNNDISMISSTPKNQIHMISSLRTPPLSSFDTTPRHSNIRNNNSIISLNNNSILIPNNNNNNNSTLFMPSISNNNTTNNNNSKLVHSASDNSMVDETTPTPTAAVTSIITGSNSNHKVDETTISIPNLLTNNNNNNNSNTNINNNLVSKTTTSPRNPNSPYHQRYSPGTYNKRSVILNPHHSPGMIMNQNQQQQRVAATTTNNNNNIIRQLPMIPNIGNNVGNNLNSSSSSSNHNRNDSNNSNNGIPIQSSIQQSTTTNTTKTNTTLNESAVNTTTTNTSTMSSSSQTNRSRNMNKQQKLQLQLLPIKKCPLLCCFYAEFDNIVGPKILYEYPNGFMEQDIHISIHNVENILYKTFQEILLVSNDHNNNTNNKTNKNDSNNSNTTTTTTTNNNTNNNNSNNSNNSDNSNNNSSETKPSQQTNDKTTVYERHDDTKSSNDDSKNNDKRHISQGEVSTITPNTFATPDPVPTTSSNIKSISMHTNSNITQETISTKTPRSSSSSNHKRIPSSSSSNRGMIDNIESSSPIPPIVVVEDSSTTFQAAVSNNTGTISKQQDTPVTWTRSHRRIPSSGSRGGGGGGGSSNFSFENNIINNSNTGTTNISTTSQQQVNSSNLKKDRNTNNTSNVTDSFTDFNVKSDHDSIFDSCSEYIITGTELSGTIVNLSTHNLHIITRPTSILDVKYERNCLSFCFGFIARRTVDPRPFRTVLSKLALLIQTMEIEHQYITKSKLYYPPSLSSSQTYTNNSYVVSGTSNNNGKEGSSFDMIIQPNIQDLLENILLSLNSVQGECNIIFQNHKGHHSSHLLSLGSSSSCYYYPDSIGDNVLNLKLFLPPRIPATPVKEYEVPILLRRDLQSYDWDLAINWVSFHIDGIMNARQISQKAEVDLEMVLACLRVLRHHGVVAIIDMFFYTNRYECTDKVSSLLLHGTTRCDEINGKNDNKVLILQQAVTYIIIDKERDMKEQKQQASPLLTSLGGGNDIGPISLSPNHHNYGSPSNFLYHPNGIDFGGLGGRSHSGGSSSYQPFASGSFRIGASSFQQQSYHHTLRDVPPKAIPLPQKRNDYNEIAVALTELYCSCHRGISIGDLLLSLVSSSSKTNVNKNQNLLHPFSTDRCIDWKKIWSLIDHRRFIIFGIVHGLLKRVHNYPLLIDEDHGTDDKEPNNKDNDDVLLSPSRKINREYDSFSLSPSAIISDNSFSKSNRSSVSFSRLKKKKSLRYGGSVEHTEEENRKMLQSNTAAMMNGLHCDDELVSNFNMPLTNLFDLVAPRKGSIEGQQQSTKKRIVSVYSVANDEDNMSA